MAELAVITKRLDFHLEQVQDFTPTPMTVSTETWYTGYDPYTLEPVFSAKTPREKQAQRQFFFWYKPEERRAIEQELKRIGRPDLIQKLYAGVRMPNNDRNFGNNRRPKFEREAWEQGKSKPERNAKRKPKSEHDTNWKPKFERDSKGKPKFEHESRDKGKRRR